MLRSTLLYLSNQPRVFRFVRNNGLAKRLARRFVAGETLDEALNAVEGLNKKGISASLDLLGESVHNAQMRSSMALAVTSSGATFSAPNKKSRLRVLSPRPTCGSLSGGLTQ